MFLGKMLKSFHGDKSKLCRISVVWRRKTRKIQNFNWRSQHKLTFRAHVEHFHIFYSSRETKILISLMSSTRCQYYLLIRKSNDVEVIMRRREMSDERNIHFLVSMETLNVWKLSVFEHKIMLKIRIRTQWNVKNSNKTTELERKFLFLRFIFYTNNLTNSKMTLLLQFLGW